MNRAHGACDPEPAIARGKEHERIPAEAGDREDVTAQLVTTCAGLDTER